MVNCDTLKFIIKNIYICSHGWIEIRNLEYTGHHRTKKATNRCCGSLFLFLEKLFKKKQLLPQQQQQKKLIIAVGSNNIIRWLALSLRPSFQLSALQMVFLSLSIGGVMRLHYMPQCRQAQLVEEGLVVGVES